MSLPFIPTGLEPILIPIAINSMLAIGLYATVLSGQLSAAHAALAGMGAYTAAILTTNFHSPFWVALCAAIVVSGGTGIGLSVTTSRMSHFVQSLATLAFGEAISVLAFNWDYLGGAFSFAGIHPFTTAPLALSLLAAVAVAVWRFETSPLGLAARATRDNPAAAATLGIDVRRTRAISFGLGGAIAGLAGGVSAHYTLVVNPTDLGFAQSFSILVWVLVGGSYTLFGPVIGAAGLTTLPYLLRFTIPYRFALLGLVIMLVVLRRPEGLITRTSRAPDVRRMLLNAGRRWRRADRAIHSASIDPGAADRELSTPKDPG